MRWPPFRHIFFDCDSTLTTIEGIDVLAENAGKGWRIKVLTEAAMNGELELEDVYRKRLQAIKPTREQIWAIRQQYKSHVVADAALVIATLQALGHQVYIISGGLIEPVREFGIFLGVPAKNIRAVGVFYNELAGNWWQHNENGDARYITYGEDALTISDGKAQIVRELLGSQRGRSLLIGDGSSDLHASAAVDLFVGFGGVVARERVRQEAPAFIHSQSMAPLLLLAAGPAAMQRAATPEHRAAFVKALHLYDTGAISFQNEQLDKKFQQACEAVHPRPH
ncbi:MAG: HAD-IB family phosphatase [Anaerolineales bacterium]|nr:HAD-IB family phosphatase [Anaerolineales bacterium]MCB8954619.1 HAD-IB family phosphatase [Ardenticatenales bacterium]